ncbi:hypothetical protein G7047_19085 [Diaphorobacter sp. HDW4A]|uniref:hypothetical protein n=1 Tax=Diaphorobacter sp. HDW4A TaxID=2714924 RepID=UPI0014083ED0|nr:hypothetical protein [Diaphorobacter sp. HDW4A]QIL81785.1 hypothetical protein G7047_19085 [Diaphorobacter sp. HDW4A]
MALRRPLSLIAGLFREMPAGDAVPIEAGGTGKDTLADAQAALGDVSAVTETTLNGSEQIGVWKSGFLKSTVAKIGEWISTASWAWTNRQYFAGGVSVGEGTSGAPDPAVVNYGSVVHLQTNTKIGGTFHIHSGVALASTMDTGWGYSQLRVLGSTNWGAFDTANPMLILSRQGSSIPSSLKVSGGLALGELSPTIKVKLVTGTLSATAGDTTNVTHGLSSAAVILGVITAVQNSTGKWWMPNIVAGPWFMTFYDDTYVSVYTQASSSSAIVGRPFKTTIFYTT